MGDGAMRMNGINVLTTIGKYWKNWSKPRLAVLVLNNRDLNQVTWEERVQISAGKTESTQSIPDFAYARYAEMLGLAGIFVNKPEDLGAAWDSALSADRPVVLEASPNLQAFSTIRRRKCSARYCLAAADAASNPPQTIQAFALHTADRSKATAQRAAL
jgi:thiamine pyrophosphate-dependent acetolactate synthase large subunit-like protein